MYVDRDWWLFRYIVIFLRDGLVPQNRCLALQLYKEAAFWKLRTLQVAIEESHLSLIRKTIGLNDDGKVTEKTPESKTKFWLNKPNWWESQGKEEVKAAKKPPQPAWWLDKSEVKAAGKKLSTYEASHGGTTYAPISSDPGKIVTAKEKDDAIPMTMSTWGYSR